MQPGTRSIFNLTPCQNSMRWGQQPGEFPFLSKKLAISGCIATALNGRPKFVASRALDRVDWNNSVLLKGEVAQEAAKLKAQKGGEIQVHGSGTLLTDPTQT